MTSPLPIALIPHGEYCYRVIPLRDGEAAPSGWGVFGQGAREAGHGKRSKRILCPYWRVASHGTVRCLYLGVEAVIESEHPRSLERAIRFFGSEALLDRVRVRAALLTDEIKICALHIGGDDDDA